ncbi:LLM class flavin-dependent oxidoreductase [Nocardioides euryhalodurans]|uniref:LLM class flavin-dependent oxidoreductase n=1 Tax=Nocardioides euryhalodurans TaxID=2518370 RepID=A0A4P7GLT9_9ACTN|nr:LLM class flavin-dependent oxidoreductase [Nocardioides euryhalodurans]QBR93095.1 LLM class flavin-dependent oxidoreductase [Nocardioides euryhalodurans]
MSTSITLNAFLMSTGHHEASWRLPGADPTVTRDARYFQELARTAERGRLDSVFFADSPSIMTDVARRPAEALEPAILLAAMAVATERIGLVATASTTYEEPYNLARTFASLDALSGGRAGWNVVTSADLRAGANFGWAEPPSHDQRYARATEFLEAVLGLWDTWQDDAVVADRERGVWADPDRIQPLEHVGEHFSVAGPLNVGRSPQGRPVIVQAGSSGPGVALAAAYAEAVFTAQPTLEEGRAFYRKLKDATAAAGRDPQHLRILPGLVPVLGGTEAEARELERRLDELVVLDHPLRQLAADVGIPVEELDLDAPLPDDIRPVAEQQGNKARYELTVAMARRDRLTVRELLLRLGSGRGHRAFVGTPEQVADTIGEWVGAGAADGFNVMPAVLPSGLEAFVDHVVPILQERGLFRREYTGSTLRDHYGLPVPARRPAPARLAATG